MNPLTRAEELAQLARDFEDDGMSPVQARAAANHQIEADELSAHVHLVAMTNPRDGIEQISRAFHTFLKNTNPKKELE